LDIKPAAKLDIIGSKTDMSLVPSECFDAVYSSHNIERLFPHEVQGGVLEFARVLVPDELALIIYPGI
jgi:hypothetical protein